VRDFQKKIINMKLHENPTSESRVVPCGPRDIQTYERIERQDRWRSQ